MSGGRAYIAKSPSGRVYEPKDGFKIIPDPEGGFKISFGTGALRGFADHKAASEWLLFNSVKPSAPVMQT